MLTEIQVRCVKFLKGVEESFLWPLVVVVIQLGGEEELLAWHAASFDAFPDFRLVPWCTALRTEFYRA